MDGTGADFTRLWTCTRGKMLEQKRFDDPEVGPVSLRMQAFGVPAAPGQELVV
ncbi:MmyB family transcriptional regulator [Nakamurella alba]|uniref:MmyB family transcriptional regulator n=1 Tax=Nakamurella alba TaxID=2665158 RepID=UPI0018AA89BE